MHIGLPPGPSLVRVFVRGPHGAQIPVLNRTNSYCTSTGDGAVHPLDLAVLPGAERPRVDVPDDARGEQLVELPAAVPRAVVGHHALDREPQARVEVQRSALNAAAGVLALGPTAETATTRGRSPSAREPFADECF